MIDSIAGNFSNWLADYRFWWALVQASVIAVAAYLLVMAARGVAPGVRVRISLLGLLLMATVPFVAVSQSGGWSWGQWLPSIELHPVSAGESTVDSPQSKTLADESTALSVWQQMLVNTSAVFVERIAPPQELAELEAQRSKVGQTAPSMPAIVFGLLCVSVFYGLIRLLAGYWQIRRLRSNSSPVLDRQLELELSACKKKLGIRRPILIAETHVLGSAAIVGWRKPLLLLPKGWQGWTPEERRAVLAHEIAHVKRSDFLSTAVGQLAVAVNFYHPLAHIVLQRLRLDQELAADSLAAQVVGGQQRYVEILAGLALRQPKVRTPGPSQAFLPSRQMFVRRLEMLRTLPNSTLGLNRCYSAAATLALIAVATLATGLRPHLIFAQDTSANDDFSGQFGESSAGEALCSYLPGGLCEAVVLVDAQEVLKSPGLSAIKEQADLPEEFELPGQKVVVKDLEQVLLAMLVSPSSAEQRAPLIVVRTKTAFSSESLNPQTRLLDAKTLAIHPSPEVLALLGRGNSDERWNSLLQQNARAAIRLASKTNWVRAMAELDSPGGPSLALAPLWGNVDTFAAGISLGDDLQLVAQLDTTDPQKVSETLTALKWLARNYLDGFPKAMKSNPTEMVMASTAAHAGRQLLDSLDINTADQQVKLKASLSNAVYPMIAFALPAITAARTAALRTQSMNNLKQMMLGLHNYHDAYGHLPPAVVVDEASGEKRSWRVELLPFLECADLYQQYRKDEPWDSPANQQVMLQMPQTFAVTGTTGTHRTPYQAIVSERGGLTRTKDGGPPKFRDFRDGLSNTVMLAETTQLVPWTQPVDLVANEATPTLGTARQKDAGILVGIADGSVRFIASSVDPRVWNALITRDGQEAVSLP